MTSHPSRRSLLAGAVADLNEGIDQLNRIDLTAMSSTALVDSVRRMTLAEEQLAVVYDRLQREVVKRTLRAANPPYAGTDREAV